MKKSKGQFAIGIDLGATKVSLGLVDHRGEIIFKIKKEILAIKKIKPALKAQNQLVNLMVDLICQINYIFPDCFKKSKFRGVGLASAGPLNVSEGCLINPANFAGWKKVPLVKMLKKKLSERGFRCPVAFQNDAMAAAFAEGWLGGAQGCESYAVVTVGTGIGAGVVFKGQALQSAGMGSEFGHLLVAVPHIHSKKDVRKFSVEGLASGTGLLRQARERGSKADRLENLEKKYFPLYKEMSANLAALCFNLSVGLNVDKILFSGGLMAKQNYFFKKTKSLYSSWIKEWNPSFAASIAVASAGQDAGLLGAASLVLKD